MENKEEPYGSAASNSNSTGQSYHYLVTFKKRFGKVGILGRIWNASTLGNYGMVVFPMVLFGVKPFVFRSLV